MDIETCFHCGEPTGKMTRYIVYTNMGCNKAEWPFGWTRFKFCTIPAGPVCILEEYKNIEWPTHERIYDLCMENAKKAVGTGYTTRMLHLSDAVERGTISPMEAYEALNYRYFPAALEVRESRYVHLL